MSTMTEPVSRLRLMPVSKFAAAPKWQLEAMRVLHEPVLFWFTQGQGRVNLGGSTRGFHPHNAIFLPPGTLHAFDTLTRVQGTIVCFGQQHGLDLPRTPLHLRLRDVGSQVELANLIDQIQRELDGGRSRAAQAAGYHLGLLSIWLDRATQTAQAAGSAATLALSANERLLARFAAMLERDYASALNVSDYARALGVTAPHLTRACRASCGRTALDLIQERRLFEARIRLRETDLPVQEIARALGFSTPGYFARAFAQQTGQSPSAYRKGRKDPAARPALRP
ncbi:MAG: helix-turn-helix domain-containing protein [Roseinatronobacter sp.]